MRVRVLNIIMSQLVIFIKIYFVVILILIDRLEQKYRIISEFNIF